MNTINIDLGQYKTYRYMDLIGRKKSKRITLTKDQFDDITKFLDKEGSKI